MRKLKKQVKELKRLGLRVIKTGVKAGWRMRCRSCGCHAQVLMP